MASTDPVTDPSTPQPAVDEQLHLLDPSSTTDSPSVQITIKFPPEQHNQTWTFDPTDTFTNLIEALTLEFPEYDWSKGKALLGKRPPSLAKSMLTPSADSSLLLPTLDGTTLRFLAPKTSSLQALQQAKDEAATLQARRAQARTRLARLPASQRPSVASSTYTFQAVTVLQHLPAPSRSMSLLQQLKADPGIAAAMQKHKFTVGMLTEMDPLQHTSATHEGVTRILGLNRNKGEVIELRLRTDRYDGYRNYKDIRKTLCHELAHNVHSNHDSDFWALTRQIEREVAQADWKSGGRTVGSEEYYEPPSGSAHEEEDEFMDHGGWEGGTYVLGGGGTADSQGLTAREVRARAAEARWSNLERATRQGQDGGGGSSSEGKKDGSNDTTMQGGEGA